MGRKYGIVTAEHCYLRSGASMKNEIKDEIFSGWAVEIKPEQSTEDWYYVETHNGYKGYSPAAEIKGITSLELLERQAKNRFFRVQIPEADLLEEPRVQGLSQELIQKNAIIELLQREIESGWSRIKTAADNVGYIHTSYLKKRKDDDGYLLAADRKNYFRNKFQKMTIDEEALRDAVVKNAMEYMGCQYRWGGKSSQGLDCSGLVCISYMEEGILLYRDAKILEGYPVHRISAEQLKKGDLILFSGHVAMYLDGDQYIHSTAYKKTPYVTINSLNPMHENFREDLVRMIEGYGSIF